MGTPTLHKPTKPQQTKRNQLPGAYAVPIEDIATGKWRVMMHIPAIGEHYPRLAPDVFDTLEEAQLNAQAATVTMLAQLKAQLRGARP